MSPTTIRSALLLSVAGLAGACTAETPVTYRDPGQLGEAILTAESERTGESGWLDVGALQLPPWAETTVSPWDVRVQEILDRLNGIQQDVLPGEVTGDRAKSRDGIGSVSQPLSDCGDFTRDCTPTIADVTTCEYRAECGEAAMSWIFTYTPESIQDTVTYYGADGRWDYGEDGFVVQTGTRTRDGKRLSFTTFQNPDNPGPRFEYTWQIDDEATIYTPWGGTRQVFTVTLSSTVFTYDTILEAYRPSLRGSMEATAPDGPVIFRDEAWSLSQQAMVPTYTVTYADGECAWVAFTDEGDVQDTGPC